jgi:heat shock protein HtpX
MLGNWFKTGLLMAAIMALFGVAGAAIGGGRDAYRVAVRAGHQSLGVLVFGRDGATALQRREVDATTAPQLYGAVRDLAARAGLPMPRVYLIDEAQPNAFATGRNPEHAAVAATRGIVELLSARELRGVLAHEMAHVRNRDMLTSTITASIAGAISALAHFGMFFGHRDDGERNPLMALLVMILAPIAAVLIQLAISRGREYEADRSGAEISGDPGALADALAKMERYTKGVPLPPAEEHPAVGADAVVVVQFHDGGLAGLFSTHLPIEERIRRLLALASQYQRGLQPR